MTLTLDDLPGVTRIGSGKVRELYAVGDDVLLVATDRISALDVVLPTPIPDKGRVLTGMTAFWLDVLGGLVPDHRITTDVAAFPAELAPFADVLRGRAMLCRRAEVIPVECVARGYLTGSGWSEYRRSGTVTGIALPPGIQESAELAEPLFTPTTKAVDGHDLPLTYAEVEDLVGAELAARLRDVTLAVYARGRDVARERGILLADTKIELGHVDGELTLVDEVLTPDSSRFWPAEGYAPGRAQPSLDKQPVRDWLAGSGWAEGQPPPVLPDDVVAATRERYTTAYEQLTGRSFADWSG